MTMFRYRACHHGARAVGVGRADLMEWLADLQEKS
jgi:hypothetical protein